MSELNSTFPLDSVKKSFVATSYLAKFDAFEKSGKENVLRRERKREREATAKISMEAFMNETVFPVTHKDVERREIGGRVFVKSSLRQYNFGSDTRTVWNATIGVNERYRRLRYVVNGPSPGPLRERGRIHLSISCMLRA